MAVPSGVQRETTSWGRARRWRLAAVGFVVLAQFAIPAAALRYDRPSAFGWQMFAANKPLPDVLVETASGHERLVDLSSLLAARRSETDLVRQLSPRLCALYPAAVAVRYQRHEPPMDQRVRCSTR